MRIGEHKCFIRTATALPGVAIGSTLKRARMAQPLVQIAASVRATTLFPVVLFNINIIAGAMAIPSDLKEATEVVRIAG